MIKKIPEEAYNQDPALRQSDFKDFLKSPQFYQHSGDLEYEQKDYFNLGSLVDCWLIEPHLVKKKFRLFTETKGLDTVKAKAFIEKLPPGVSAITPEMNRKAAAMVSILRGYVNLPADDRRQLSAFTTARGVPMKARCDWIGDDGFIYDLKTTSANLKFWADEALLRGYDIQSAWYQTCFEDLKPIGMRFVIITTTAPHTIDFWEASAETEGLAVERICDGLDQYKKCAESGIWEWPDRQITYKQF